MLRHHQVCERTGSPDPLSSLGVMPTPNHDGRPPWDTALIRVQGPSGLTADQLQEFYNCAQGAGI